MAKHAVLVVFCLTLLSLHVQATAGSIAFSSDRNGTWDLYLVNGDGTGLRRLTDHPGHETQPDFSPDGTRLAYVRYAQIRVLDLTTGSNQLVYQSTGDPSMFQNSGGPDWSPDGSRLAISDGPYMGYQLKVFELADPLGTIVDMNGPSAGAFAGGFNNRQAVPL